MFANVFDVLAVITLLLPHGNEEDKKSQQGGLAG
jgi:hypothetical protein